MTKYILMLYNEITGAKEEDMASMNKEDQEILRKREAWLNKRKLTVRQVADAVRLDYNTVVRYFSNTPRHPRSLYAERMREVFADFPI